MLQDTSNDSISVETLGGKLSFLYTSKYSGKQKVSRIGKGPTANFYYVYFEEDDVDFKIRINNNLCKDRSISFRTETLEDEYGFVVDEGKSGQLESFKPNGRKLHFICQSGKQGKTLWSKTASSSGLSLNDSLSHRRSLIKFKMSYSKLPQYSIRVNLPSKIANVYVNLVVDQSTTMADLKSKIVRKIGHPSSNFILTWKDLQRDDNLTMKSLEIEGNSQVNVISVGLPVQVQMNVTFHTFQMSSWDSIDDLKERISNADGIPVVLQKLVFQEKELRSYPSVSSSLGSSNIVPNSQVQLTILKMFDLEVKFVPSNKIIVVRVSSRFTVHDVYEKLKTTHGITMMSDCPKIYAHGEKVSGDVRMLGDIGITDSSSKVFVVEPDIKADGGDEQGAPVAKRKRMNKKLHKCPIFESFLISVKPFDKTKVVLPVCPSETVEELTKKIERKLGRQVKTLATTVKKKLVFLAKKYLPLEVYEVGVNSKIREVSGIPLFIKQLTGKTLSMKCSPRLTIKGCKHAIQETEGIPVDEQQLCYAGKPLEDGRTLEDCNFREDHVPKLNLVLRLKGGGGCRGCNDQDCECHEVTMLNVSERGAITFGEKSSQTFSTVQFKEDKLLKTIPFTVELRLAPASLLD